MSDYTPSTRAVFLRYASTLWSTEEANARFYRWLDAHEAEVAQKARAEGWEAARAEVRMIPSWYNSDTKQGGFDLQHGEVASEEGAWMEVMRVLNANPFTTGQEDKP